VAAVFVPLDEFPVAVADSARRRAALVAVVRIVPEQWAATEFAALEQRHETHAVAVLIGRQRQAGQIEMVG